MRNMFRITYDIVTEESVENGEITESGYIMTGGWHGDVKTPEDMAAVALDLRSALRLCDGGLEDCGQWFMQSQGETNYRTGEEETRSLHPPRNITSASYGRLKRLLRVK